MVCLASVVPFLDGRKRTCGNRTRTCLNVRSKMLVCRNLVGRMEANIDSISGCFRHASVENALTAGTKIIADPEKCFQELISHKLLILLRDRLCLELSIVSSNFHSLLVLQDKITGINLKNSCKKRL